MKNKNEKTQQHKKAGVPGTLALQDDEMQAVNNDVHHLHVRSEEMLTHMNPVGQDLKIRKKDKKK